MESGDEAAGGAGTYEYYNNAFGDRVVKHYFEGSTYFYYANKEKKTSAKVHQDEHDEFLNKKCFSKYGRQDCPGKYMGKKKKGGPGKGKNK